MKKSKVRLRLYKERDFEFLHGLLSDKITRKYFPLMYTVEREQTFLRLRTRLLEKECGINSRFVIESKKLRKPVGEVSGRVNKEDSSCIELAVLVHPDFRGMGYAQDGIMEFIEKMRELKPEITKYRMIIAETNKASQAVAKKLEFELKDNKTYGKNIKTNMQYWERN